MDARDRYLRILCLEDWRDTMGETPIAVLGLGEAGSAFASDLIAAGGHVRAYDPVITALPGAVNCVNEADAARTAGLILSVNTGGAALSVFQAAADHVAAGAVWADMNTTAPTLKRRLSTLASVRGVAFADIAIMGAVAGRGLATRLLASGDGAPRAAMMLGAYGAYAEVLDGRQPNASFSEVCFTRVCRLPSSRLLRRHMPWGWRTGCGTTLLKNLPTHRRNRSIRSCQGHTAMPPAELTKWKLQRRCSPI